MFQRDSAHTGAHPSADGPGDALDEQWVIADDALIEDFDAEVKFADLSPPVVADGTVYATFASPRQDFGAGLVALDAADGSRRWQTVVREEYVPPAAVPFPSRPWSTTSSSRRSPGWRRDRPSSPSTPTPARCSGEAPTR